MTQSHTEYPRTFPSNLQDGVNSAVATGYRGRPRAAAGGESSQLTLTAHCGHTLIFLVDVRERQDCGVSKNYSVSRIIAVNVGHKCEPSRKSRSTHSVGSNTNSRTAVVASKPSIVSDLLIQPARPIWVDVKGLGQTNVEKNPSTFQRNIA